MAATRLNRVRSCSCETASYIGFLEHRGNGHVIYINNINYRVSSHDF